MDPRDRPDVPLNSAEAIDVIIMAKAPVAGEAKTRLAAGIGADAAADWSRRTLWKVCARLQGQAGWSLHLAITPDDADPTLFPPELPRMAQGEGDLGQRMERLLAPPLLRPRIIIGSDLPTLDRDHLLSAWSLLRNNHGAIVLGPAYDGGFWLIATTNPLAAGTLADLAWSHDQVLAQTRQRLIDWGHEVRLHPDRLPDVDHVADLCQPRAGLDLPTLHHQMSIQRPDLADRFLEPLPDAGLAHDHVRLLGGECTQPPLLMRIPKQSQMDLDPAEALAYERVCFERAQASGHSPRLLGVLEPASALPRGALLVEEIAGRAPRLPADLSAIMPALAAVHRLPLPAMADRSSLLAPVDPLAHMLAEVSAQASYLPAAQLAPADAEAIQAALQQVARCDHGNGMTPPVCLITFDAHPGNWLIDSRGKAWIVDLEKMRYSLPGFDLAHATLYTSTTWDVATSSVISQADVLGAYRLWADAMGPQAAAHWPWLGPARAAMLLWSLTWCCLWRVTHRAEAVAARRQNWSQDLSAPMLVKHVRDRVDDYLSEGRPRQLLAEAFAVSRWLGEPCSAGL